MDLANDRVQAKIKNAAGMKIPYSAIVGPRDEEAQAVSLRAFGRNEALGQCSLDEFVVGLEEEIRSRGTSTLRGRFE